MKTNKVEQILLEHLLFGLFELPLEPQYILGIYIYGSRSYNNTHPDSDLDYAVVLSNNAPLWREGMAEYIQFESKDLDMHIMSENHYKQLLNEHNMMALEMFYALEPIKRYKAEFNLNLSKLRRSVSAIANNSWVKGKKKISLEEENSKIGLKSLYHSFRIIDFGIQIAKERKINFEYKGPVKDQDAENIRNPKWDYWNKKLKTIHNQKMTDFRKLAPKEK